MRSTYKLQCPKCGEKLLPEDTAIIKVTKPRFEERKHHCPRCNSFIAIEIGPNDDTQKSLPVVDKTPLK